MKRMGHFDGRWGWGEQEGREAALKRYYKIKSKLPHIGSYVSLSQNAM